MELLKPAAEFNAIVVSIDRNGTYDWVTILSARSNHMMFSADPGLFEIGQTVPVQIGIRD